MNLLLKSSRLCHKSRLFFPANVCQKSRLFSANICHKSRLFPVNVCHNFGGLRKFSVSRVEYSKDIRNVGIMAHIDAGKTTTSERMLYYTGYMNRVGEVHHGDTVMDHMDQERDRGITITAAAITFPWMKHQINLIDTPGHVDFTMEVERSLRVLDGAILVLDASAGVQAQTMTVWRQALRNEVPRLAYINKMDKYNANLAMTLRSMKRKLGVTPLLTQIPIGNGKELRGVMDLVAMEALIWTPGDESCGREYSRLSEEAGVTSLRDTWLAAQDAREMLLETAADFDDELADKVIGEEDVSGSDLDSALRRIVLNSESGALVTFLGSSFKNIGVQPLMDGMVKYLPSPLDKKYKFTKFYGKNFCGMVFKIQHHPQKGVLSYVRVYSGSIKSTDSVYNVNRAKSEKVGKLMIAFADDFREVSAVGAGNIAVISGLKLSITGDTLVPSSAVAKNAEKLANGHDAKTAEKLANEHDAKDEEVGDDDEEVGRTVLAGPVVPEPVFFCSVEPPSLASQKQFDLALACLSREDPSLKVEVNKETGQTVLGGMGELHLDIIKERIMSGWKVEVDLGQLQVAYREMLDGEGRETINFERTIAGKCHSLTVDVAIRPLENAGKSRVEVSKSRETKESLSQLKIATLKCIERGLMDGLSVGPRLGFPVLDCLITLHGAQVGRGTSSTMIMAGSMTSVRTLLKKVGVRLAEPIMALEVTTDKDYVSLIGQDIVRKRGQVDQASGPVGCDQHIVTGFAPLAELRGYSNQLRSMTSGKAHLAMELSHYQIMDEFEQNKAIEDVTGFAPS